MALYVRLKINGRNEFWKLVKYLNDRGIYRVEYHNGGWTSNVVDNIAPHLKFEDEEEALAYVLSKGGEISRTIPTVDPII